MPPDTLAEPELPCPHCTRNPKQWRQWFKSTAPGWGHPRQGPHRRWADIYANGAYMVRHRGWLDHLYRLRRNDGTILFVAEPYHLTAGDLADLAHLDADGWAYSISGAGAHHETTLRVHIERKASL